MPWCRNSPTLFLRSGMVGPLFAISVNLEPSSLCRGEPCAYPILAMLYRSSLVTSPGPLDLLRIRKLLGNSARVVFPGGDTSEVIKAFTMRILQSTLPSTQSSD